MYRVATPLLAILATALAASTAAAFTHHDESVDGDLSGAAPPTFELVVGENLVLGTLPGTPASDTADPFTFTLPGGREILSIVLSHRPLENGESLNVGLTFQGTLADDGFPGTETGSGATAVFVDTVPPITGTLDRTLGGSTWRLDVNSGLLFGPVAWTVRVETIPEPSTLLLACAGGLVLARARRRIARA